jgi:segregation and condensation protein A
MPTPEDYADALPPPRATRRPLGRGPGAAPPGDGAGAAREGARETGGPAGGAAEESAEQRGTAGAVEDAAQQPGTDGERPEAPRASGGSHSPDGHALEAQAGAEPPVEPPEVPPRGGPVEEPAAEEAFGQGETGEPVPGEADAAGYAAGEGVPAQDLPDEQAPDDGRFKVVLDNFEGPFDLLLQLISKHKLDVTEVALSKVTDEFMTYIHAMGPDWDLDQTTEFLVVAATLLDLKAARLLPAAEIEDEADLALLEARDLLFARLLQYRAYKEIAAIFAGRLVDEARRHPRTVGLEPHHAELLPDVVISIGPEGFAKLAVKAMRPKPKPQVYVEHIHAPLVSVREQAEVVVARLRERGEVTFQELARDAPDTLTVVARFLALLELYRERAVSLEQDEALGELIVRWSGEEGARPVVTDEFDQEAGPREAKDAGETPVGELPADERHA